MKNAKIKMNPFVASLLPDSDKKMGAIAGASLLVALALSFCAAAYERVIDVVIFDDKPEKEMLATMNIIEKKEEKKELPKNKKKEKEINRKKPGGGGKPQGKGNPHAPQTRGVLKILTTQTKNASSSVYDLMKNQKFARDIDKVIKTANGLQTTGKTRIGERRGKVDGGFNDGFSSGGSGGLDGSLSNLIGGSTGALSTKAKGNLRTPSAREIDMGSGGGTRSVTDIMKVVKQRTPGLRHIYNKFLKKQPGFSGKVTLKFTIAPGGDVIVNIIVSSTTGYGEFDQAVRKAVSGWTFDKIRSGNTTVTIPFTFSE